MSKTCLFWRTAVACALVIGWLPLAVADDDAKDTPQEHTQNAATHYLRAAKLLPDISWEVRKQIRDALEKQDVATCSSLLRKHGEAFDKVFELVALGVRCDECDWETDYSEGPNSLLPHIDDAILIVPVGFARALEHAQKGEWKQAVDAWACSMTVGRHISSNPCLVCLMISIREERAGIAVATELLSRIDDEQQRTRLREAWGAFPDRPSVHSVAIKEHAWLIAWAKSHPADLLQFVNGSFMSGGVAGHRISLKPPTFFEQIQGVVLVQSANWPEIERLASINIQIAKLPADKIDESSKDLVAQIGSLPTGSTRSIASELIPAVSSARVDECELEVLAESLARALKEQPK